MKPSDVAQQIGALRKLSTIDREAACAGAEELRIAVLQQIANANPAAIALAKAVLVTIDEDIGGA